MFQTHYVPQKVKDLACETRVVDGSSGVGTWKIMKCQRVVEC